MLISKKPNRYRVHQVHISVPLPQDDRQCRNEDRQCRNEDRPPGGSDGPWNIIPRLHNVTTQVIFNHALNLFVT